ncbi:MAG: hypothetical protein PVG89_07205 [Gammaproteobacteria bacterium]|jgi:hypothetical protein
MKGLKLDLMTVLVLFVVASVFFTMATGFGDGKESKVNTEHAFQGSAPKTAGTVISGGYTATHSGTTTQSTVIRASTKALWN